MQSNVEATWVLTALIVWLDRGLILDYCGALSELGTWSSKAEVHGRWLDHSEMEIWVRLELAEEIRVCLLRCLKHLKRILELVLEAPHPHPHSLLLSTLGVAEFYSIRVEFLSLSAFSLLGSNESMSSSLVTYFKLRLCFGKSNFRRKE